MKKIRLGAAILVALSSCKMNQIVLDSNSGTVVNCNGNKATIVWMSVDKENGGSAPFYIEDCEEWKNKVIILKKQ
jgi:Cft2 family RNA processing exonuclease